MLIELLSMSNYGNYNIKVAQILGLESAIYLNELMNINEKAVRKNKITENFFTIDREYITSRTTLTSERQEELEVNLIKVGILERIGKNDINLNISALTSILAAPDEELVKTLSKVIKKPKTPKKEPTDRQASIANNMKTAIITTNEELISAYSEWIESVIHKDGWMSKKAVTVAQQVVDQFANHNLDVALKIIEIATINGYRDMSWAIANYRKNYNVAYTVNNNPTFTTNISKSSNLSAPKPRAKLSEEVF